MRPFARRFRLLVTALGALAVALGPDTGQAQIKFEGRVTDPSGTPIPDVDLDYFETQFGFRVDPSAPGYEGQEDKTDVFGYFEMVIEPDIYDVRFEPPEVRPDIAPIFRRNLILGTDTVLDVTLPGGFRLSGRVVGRSGEPVANVDLDANDPATGQRLATVRDDTAADGTYGVTVIPGVWDFTFEPPLGSGHGPVRIQSVDVTRDARLDVTLPRGFVVSGRVVNQAGAGVFFADLDVFDVEARHGIPTSDDETDGSGEYRLNIPEGTFHFFATPPPGLPVASAARYDVKVGADVVLDPLTLVPGVAITGVALDPSGLPLSDADLDLHVANTCLPYPVADDRTDAGGAFAFRVTPGTYDVTVTAGGEPPRPPFLFEAVSLTADTNLELRVPAWTPQLVDVESRVVGEDGQALAAAVVTGDPVAGGSFWTATTVSDGSIAARVTAGIYRITVDPPPGSELATRRLDAVSIPCDLPATFVLEPSPDPGAGVTGVDLSGYPNPARGVPTHISVALPQAAPNAVVEIYDLLGRRVHTLHRGSLPGGVTELLWDGRNAQGRQVASGLYVLCLRGASEPVTAKITRIRQ